MRHAQGSTPMCQGTLTLSPQAPLDQPELHHDKGCRDLEEGLNPVGQPSSQHRSTP